MTMMEFWTSIPLMALAALGTGVLLLVLSVREHRRPEPVVVRSEPPSASDAEGFRTASTRSPSAPR